MRRPLYVATLVFLSLALMAQSFPTNTFDNGFVGTPSRAYRLDPQLGSYRIMPNNEGFVSDGSLRWHWSSTLMHLTSGLDLRVGGGAFFQSAVGVGTNDPTSALHVVGSVALTGTLATQGGLALGGVTAPTSTLHVVGSAAIYGSLTTSGGNVAVQSGTLIMGSNAIGLTTDIRQGSGVSTCWSSTTSYAGALDLCVARNASGVLEINSGNAGAVRDVRARGLHLTGTLHAQTSFAVGAHMVTIASDGAGTANAETLSGERSLYLVDCNDANGCALTLGTANIEAGATTRIFNVSTNSNVATITSVASAQHVFSLFTMATNHSIAFMYVRNRSGAGIWVETSRNGRAP